MPLAGIKTFITFAHLQPTSDGNLRQTNATLKKGHRVQTVQHPGYAFPFTRSAPAQRAHPEFRKLELKLTGVTAWTSSCSISYP